MDYKFIFLKIFLCLCSCTTCCRTDFRFCQQDLRQHRTRGSHGRTGRPAGPHIQNLEKEATSTEKSGEKRHYHHHHVLSCCNYAPLCMPFNPEYTHIVCHTSTHTTSCVCVYVCVLVSALHLYDTHPRFCSLRTVSRDDASLSPNPL